MNYNLAKTGQTGSGGKQSGGKTAIGTQIWYGNAPLTPKAGPYQNPARPPPTQAETWWNNTTNPQGTVKPLPATTEMGNARASSVMAYSTHAVYFGVSNKAKPKPATTNTNAAPPWLKTYGGAFVSGNSARPEASVYAMGGGQQTTLRKNAGKRDLSRKV